MSIGVWELVLILAVVVLLFGTGKLTRSMGDLARGFRSFRDEMKDTTPEPAAPAPSASPEPVVPKALPAPAETHDVAAAAVRNDQPARS